MSVYKNNQGGYSWVLTFPPDHELAIGGNCATEKEAHEALQREKEKQEREAIMEQTNTPSSGLPIDFVIDEATLKVSPFEKEADHNEGSTYYRDGYKAGEANAMEHSAAERATEWRRGFSAGQESNNENIKRILAVKESVEPLERGDRGLYQTIAEPMKKIRESVYESSSHRYQYKKTRMSDEKLHKKLVEVAAAALHWLETLDTSRHPLQNPNPPEVEARS